MMLDNLALGIITTKNSPQKIEGRFEKAFRLGHKNLKSLSMFKNKSTEKKKAIKNLFLPQYVLNDEINEVHTKRTSPRKQS